MEPKHKFNSGMGATICCDCSSIICTGLTKDLYCAKCKLKHMTYSDALYDYLFHYNPYNEKWNAIPRDKYLEYWSSKDVEGVISSSKYETLIELITKGDDFINSIE
jgi:hypothetical protein